MKIASAKKITHDIAHIFVTAYTHFPTCDPAIAQELMSIQEAVTDLLSTDTPWPYMNLVVQADRLFPQDPDYTTHPHLYLLENTVASLGYAAGAHFDSPRQQVQWALAQFEDYIDTTKSAGTIEAVELQSALVDLFPLDTPYPDRDRNQLEHFGRRLAEL